MYTGKQGSIKEVANENIEKVNPGMTLFDVFKKMQMNRYDIVPVLDNDKFKGILDLESINEFFLIQNTTR